MKKHQVDPDARAWRGECGDHEPNASCARRLSQERTVHKDLADRKRAEYLRLHDDDEAELEPSR